MNPHTTIWRARTAELPIMETLEELAAALQLAPSAVLSAPPGAGKTTVVPLALLDAGWLGGRRIIMLEPRRLAARAAARRMASLLGDSPGGIVGYRVRNDTMVSDRTRIEVVTEGVLTRMLQRDATLDEYGLVIFDEFHERNIHGDTGLALTLHAQRILRNELRILVMSATLDVDAVARYLGGAAVIRSAGRMHPVEIRYAPPRGGVSLDAAAVAAVSGSLRANEGDILVFLPGLAEISRVQNSLREDVVGRGAEVHTLHSSTPTDKQDAAIRPAAPGVRKVVLSTTIAETSITIDGVRVVVDAGLTRVPRYSPRTGLTSLETVRVTRASAEQRAGRAGRTAPGICYRLWNEHEQQALLERWLPEILDADLTPLVLDLAVVGVADPMELAWLDAPPAPAITAARELLRQLGALDASGWATKHGRDMSELGLHPRLAHMILRSRETGLAELACDLAALMEERDVVKGDERGDDVDLRTRIHIVNRRRGGRGGGGGLDRAISAQTETSVVDRVIREGDRLRALVRATKTPGDERATGLPLAFAYPDRIARRRDAVASRFLMRNGAGAMLQKAQALSASEFIVIAELDGRRPESRIWRAAPIDVEDIQRHFADQIETESEHEWDDDARGVRLVRRERLGAIVLRESVAPPTDPSLAAAMLGQKVVEARLANLNWSREGAALRERIGFLARHQNGWPDLSDAALIQRAEEWLVPRLHGMKNMQEVRTLDMTAIILDMIGWQRRGQLDELAPSHITVPSGSRIPVDYSDPDAPMISVRLQELFGMADTPGVLGGKVPITVQVLSPANRPVQVTRDLAGFWRSSYFEVRKEMRGRYPKHQWPENPLTAQARRGGQGGKKGQG